MAADVQLLCLASSSGVPLYCRSKGRCRQLPFSVIGSLNGVHMFGSNQDVLLTSTCTENARVFWRVFHDSITLIVMTSQVDASDLYLSRLLHNVFSSMVLLIGQDDLVNIKNVERLKRDLRSCYKLIDGFLSATEGVGDLTQSVGCVLVTDSERLQEALDAFVAAADSHFGCLMVAGKMVVATAKWWRLEAQEVMLLAWLVASLPPSSSRDYPIYLPHGSPTVPHRLLTFQLLPGLEVCLLCGPAPSLEHVHTQLVARYWSPELEMLKGCVRAHQRSVPHSMPLHQSILGFLLINTEQNKNLFTLQPHGSEDSSLQALPIERRECILRSFYSLAVSTYFPVESGEQEPGETRHLLPPKKPID
ncbi:protein fuzzy homolog isoform X2 [Callorhinchus milii]|uniref:protein fuzzy homolog isoform X2 n=1 Tax=Callorhinchus milii TaxID=7868 RepID=UPI001C3FD695|nr:protein fuzzy homolog isoform X2 [Callorhinchus milii]